MRSGALDALGVEAKGVSIVDFDSDGEYYSWRWPEPALDHFHGHDEGFAWRSRIQ